MSNFFKKKYIVGFALSSVLATSGIAQEANTEGKGPQIAAHRGGAMHYPENTMRAFEYAAELGVEILEFDMVMTADDELVVHHDARINPNICTPDEGSEVVAKPVRALTYDETQQFDCGTLVRGIYDVPGYVADPGARIPKVDEVLERFSKEDVAFFAETKVPGHMPGIKDIDSHKFASLINDLVVKHGLEDRFTLQSGNYQTIDAMHQINPEIRTCLLGAHNWDHRRFLETLEQHHASCILLRDSVTDKDEVKRLQAEGIQIYSEVSDSPEDWQIYKDLGVDVVITNDPGGFIEFAR